MGLEAPIPLTLKKSRDSGCQRIKSPFFKGGFRGIIKGYYNPPCPPLEKGGKIKSAKSRAAYSPLTAV